MKLLTASLDASRIRWANESFALPTGLAYFEKIQAIAVKVLDMMALSGWQSFLKEGAE